METIKKIASKAFAAVAIVGVFIKKIASKVFATVAILGVFVAICTMDDSAHEVALRLGGIAAFAIGIIGWSLTSTEKEVEI